jgi:hypothetical protein
MPVEDVAARVVEVLTRAESLFAIPADAAAAGEAAGRVSDAAAASRAIASRTADLSGAAATAHSAAVGAAAERLEHTASTDSELAERVADTADAHHGGGSHAAELRASAAEIPSALGPAVRNPAGEVAALKALRNRVAGMQRLLAEHSGESARVAGEIRNLGYRP